MDNPTPWTTGENYDQCEPGYYIVDADGHLVLADTEGILTRETRDLIVALRNTADLCSTAATDAQRDLERASYYRNR